VVKVSVVVGNPTPNSRTARVATQLVKALLPHGGFDLSVIDLAEHAHRMFDPEASELTQLLQEVAAGDLLIVASPTYKATYTGLLKAFLDRYPNLGLRAVVAIPVMTGGDARHALAPEVSLRPLLVELGAIVPTQGLYFLMNQIDHLDAVLADWAREARERVCVHLPAVLACT
jgi:FMN reductase